MDPPGSDTVSVTLSMSGAQFQPVCERLVAVIVWEVPKGLTQGECSVTDDQRAYAHLSLPRRVSSGVYEPVVIESH